MKGRNCGQSRFQDWDRGVGGDVAKRPLLLCPGPNELPRRGKCLAEAAEFRFTGVGLLCGPESLRAQGGSLMEGRCAGADEGDMREAALSDVRQVGHIVYHCAGERGADCGSKVLGRCERGKGASASEAVAEYSMVGRGKSGRLRAADAAEVGHAKGFKIARLQARQMFGPIGFSVAGVLSAYVFCLVSCLTQRALVASYCIPLPAGTGGHILWTRILPSCSYTSG